MLTKGGLPRAYGDAPRSEFAPSKPRIVFLDHVAELSGGELALLRLLKVMEDVDAHVILAEDGPLVARLRQAGVSVEVMLMRGRTRQLRKGSVSPGRLPLAAVLDTSAYALRLALRLRRLQPQIVHTNSLKSGIYGSIAGRIARKPIVWHLRDRVDVDYLSPLGVFTIRILIRLAAVVISNSEVTRETLGSRVRSVVIPSLVEATHTRPNRTYRTGPLVVGMVGRIAPWKGQDVFLRAFAQAFPCGDQQALIIGAPLFGDAETRYASQLVQLAVDLEISARVDFRGHSMDVESDLATMDVLVHASVIPEPFGQVIVEGMSAELAVVASRAGGPEEIITHGVDGLLYDCGNIDSLASNLVRLQKEPELRERLGRAGACRARDYSAAVIVPMVMRAYAMCGAQGTQAFGPEC